ncbi:MAG: UDP-N-acetylmuramoyl-L-alanine--D-glutamate ligase [Alphaproteobacteria bacterium]|nr:UDP-N-acetylmuramoyl-L-alanine--D-glutamate ligase [Alphaproteobacteria bacterium]
MIAARSFSGKTVAVFGLARTGLASVRALKAGGAQVIAWDDNSAARDAGYEAGAEITPWREWAWEAISALILSPGVPLTHPRPHEAVLHAKSAGVAVIGDVELFAREIRPDAGRPGKAPVIAITGTNGKSTTTALLGHILASAGFDAQVGGNIGKAVLELAPPGPKTIYVLEMSSFQIDLAPGLHPDVALLSNLTPDHIDRHGSMENYAAIKERLLRQVPKDGQVIVGVDDAYGAAIFTALSSNGGAAATPVSVGKILGRGVFAVDGILYDAHGQRTAEVMAMEEAPRLPGAHNWQNIALAYAAARNFIKDSRAIVGAISSFPGLAHRMEEVGHIGRVRFINDSKATNADATARALACYPDIFWIAGGKPKEGGIAALSDYFPRIRKAYLIGEAAEAFAGTLEGRVVFSRSGTLDKAVEEAAADAARAAAPAPVVLLSPASASYDQFKDFEQRGDVFRALVARLPRDARQGQKVVS